MVERQGKETPDELGLDLGLDVASGPCGAQESRTSPDVPEQVLEGATGAKMPAGGSQRGLDGAVDRGLRRIPASGDGGHGIGLVGTCGCNREGTTWRPFTAARAVLDRSRPFRWRTGRDGWLSSSARS